MDYRDLERTDFDERLGILFAILLPDQRHQLTDQDASPINIFRFLLRTYFGGDTDPLPVRNYFSDWEFPYDFQEVTDLLEPGDFE